MGYMTQSLSLVISDLEAVEKGLELTVEEAAIVTGGTSGEESETYGKDVSSYGKHPVIIRFPKCPPYKPPVIQCITAPCP